MNQKSSPAYNMVISLLFSKLRSNPMYLQAPLRVLTEFKLMSLQMFVVVKKKNFGSTTVLATQMAQFKQF